MKKSDPALTLLPANGFRRTPWKNGRGVTQEIATEPSGASLGEELLWRLSVAPVTEEGPFSAFPGLRRYLTLIEGTELQLAFPQKLVSLRPGDVYHFAGEEEVSARLPAGPVRDLGLLFHPGRVRAELDVLEFQNKVRSFAVRRRAIFFYALSGSYKVGCYPGGEELNLKSGACLRVDSMGQERVLAFEPAGGGGLVACVELDW